MGKDKKLPREVVARALAAAKAPAQEDKPKALRATKAAPQNPVKARVIAHLRRLHPMD